MLPRRKGTEHGEQLCGRFSAPKLETLWYYRSLLKAHRQTQSRLVAELERVLGELERLAGAGPSVSARAAPGVGEAGQFSVRNQVVDGAQ